MLTSVCNYYGVCTEIFSNYGIIDIIVYLEFMVYLVQGTVVRLQ